MVKGFNPAVGSIDEIAEEAERRSISMPLRRKGFVYDSVIVLCGDENYKDDTLEEFKKYGFERPFVRSDAGGAGLLHPDCGHHQWERQKLQYALYVAGTNNLGLAIHDSCKAYNPRSGLFCVSSNIAGRETQKRHLLDLLKLYQGLANVTALLPYRKEDGKFKAIPIAF